MQCFCCLVAAAALFCCSPSTRSPALPGSAARAINKQREHGSRWGPGGCAPAANGQRIDVGDQRASSCRSVGETRSATSIGCAYGWHGNYTHTCTSPTEPLDAWSHPLPPAALCLRFSFFHWKRSGTVHARARDHLHRNAPSAAASSAHRSFNSACCHVGGRATVRMNESILHHVLPFLSPYIVLLLLTSEVARANSTGS